MIGNARRIVNYLASQETIIHDENILERKHLTSLRAEVENGEVLLD